MRTIRANPGKPGDAKHKGLTGFEVPNIESSSYNSGRLNFGYSEAAWLPCCRSARPGLSSGSFRSRLAGLLFETPTRAKPEQSGDAKPTGLVCAGVSNPRPTYWDRGAWRERAGRVAEESCEDVVSLPVSGKEVLAGCLRIAGCFPEQSHHGSSTTVLGASLTSTMSRGGYGKAPGFSLCRDREQSRCSRGHHSSEGRLRLQSLRL
jgi:hypothetical protein